jgi:hypothetical protein
VVHPILWLSALVTLQKCDSRVPQGAELASCQPHWTRNHCDPGSSRMLGCAEQSAGVQIALFRLPALMLPFTVSVPDVGCWLLGPVPLGTGTRKHKNQDSIRSRMRDRMSCHQDRREGTPNRKKLRRKGRERTAEEKHSKHEEHPSTGTFLVDGASTRRYEVPVFGELFCAKNEKAHDGDLMFAACCLTLLDAHGLT